MLERERKDKEREELKRKKELQKQEDAKKREMQKQQQHENQKKDAKSQNGKGGSKDTVKLKQQIRRDTNNEVRKNRNDASGAVLQFYDYEEMEEAASMGQNSSSGARDEDENRSKDAKSLLASFCSSLPDVNIVSSSNGSESLDVENTLLLSTTLNLLRNHLNLETSPKVDYLLRCLGNVYALPKSNPESSDAELPQDVHDSTVEVNTVVEAVDSVKAGINSHAFTYCIY